MPKSKKEQLDLRPVRKKTNATERKGVGYVRDVVENANCVFREIDRSGDYGHDAFVLIVDGQSVSSVEIAVQIKSGRSFCKPDRCQFSATVAQLNFWAGHGLTTLGVIYDPDADCAWWIDLTEVAKEYRKTIGSRTVYIPKDLWNRFDEHGFRKVLIPSLLGRAPDLDLCSAIQWCSSEDYTTHDLGVRTLLARHREESNTWKTIIDLFQSRGNTASFEVLRGIIKIMGHTDEGYYGNEVPWGIRSKIQDKVLAFGKGDFIKLISFVEDGDFSRGAVGWGLFAIIPPHPQGLKILNDIAIDDSIDVSIRDDAKTMISIYQDDPSWWELWKPSRQYLA